MQDLAVDTADILVDLNTWKVKLLNTQEASKIEFLRNWERINIKNHFNNQKSCLIDKTNSLSSPNKIEKVGMIKIRRLLIRIDNNIHNAVKEVRFQTIKERRCNCIHKQKNNLKISLLPYKTVRKIGKYSDSKYEYELYRCTSCELYWIKDLWIGDGRSQGFKSFDKVHPGLSPADVIRLINHFKKNV